MNVQMPDGTIITDVPENITQKELLARYNKFKAPPVPQNKGTLGDLGTAIKQGVARIPEGLAGLADIPVELATGKNYITEAGKKLADVTGLHPSEYAKSLEAEKSAGYQQAQAEANALWKAHDEGKASYGDIAAFYAKHPALTATNIVESAPSMVVGGAYGRALKGAGALSAVARGAIGESAVSAGQLNAAMNEEGGGSRQKALAAALGGAGTGLIAGGSGALARRMGIIDPETFLAGKSGNLTAKELADFEQAAQRGIAARLGLGALQEGALQELPQSVQEQMFQNWGTGKPIMEGVGRQAIEGLLAGAVLGGGFNVLGRGDVNQQIQDRKDAEFAAQQAAAQQAQRQATGVMEQQPLLAPQEMPVAEPTTTPPAFGYDAEGKYITGPAPTPPSFGYDAEGKFTNEPAPEVSPDQSALFTRKGAPTKEAKASVEAARLQGLPSQIQELTQTPEGRAQIAGNMKMYFPDLSVKERNALRPQIQAGTYGVAPTEAPAAVEGTLTPDLLKTYGITPRNKQYTALAGASLADPTTYNLLTTAASTSTDFGVKANRILEAFPQFKPSEEAATPTQPTPTEVVNEPEAQAAEPVQPDLLGVPAVGTPPVEPGAEQGMGQPVQQQGAAPAQAEEPVGGGVAVPSGAPDGNLGQPAASADVQPSALAPVPPRVAKQAAAALKKEPIAQAWGYMSDTPYAKLSKVAKDKVKDAHAQGYLTQELADEIDRIEAGNARAEAASAAIKPEAELDEDKVALDKALSTLDAGLQQFANTKLNVMPEDKVSVGDMLNALGEVMYLLVKRGVKSLNEAMRLAKKELGPNADMLSDEQYKQAYDSAIAKAKQATAKPAKAEPTGLDPVAQAQAQQAIAGMSGTLAQSVPTQPTTTTQVLGNIASTMTTNPSGAFGMIEEMANKFRTKVIDKAAHLSAAIQDANSGAFYNVNGLIRADLLLSAVNNINNYINAVFTMGGMEILPNGSIRATEAKHSIDGVFRHAQTLGERIGVTQARALITNAFYHYRAKSIIDNVPKDQWPENWRKDPRMVPTQAQINAAMAAFNQFPELRAMQDEFIGSKNEMVKFLEQSGFLSPEKAKAFLADDSYAPWLRLKEYQDVIPGIGNTGKMVDLRQMKALVGGTEEVNDMLENMAQMIGWCVRSGVSNHTANSALNTMSTMGTATRHASRPGTGNPAHVVMTYEAGKPVFWTVDNPYDLAAFQTVSGMDSAVMREIGKWLGKLRAGIVLFPAFPLRQVVMDSQRAFVESGVDKPWAMMGKIYKSFLSGEGFRGTDADIQELMSQGVVGAVDFTAYDSTRGRASQFGMGEAPKTISDKFVATSGYQFLHKLAYSADLAVRLGIYRQTLEETGDKTLAATRAREIINFQKAGTSEFMHTLKQTIPFMGAYLQGMDVNYKGMVGRGNSMKQRKAAAAAYWGNMATYAGLVIMYTMANSGDDEYEEQKGFVTDRNFLVPGGGLIPVPPDVGFLAKVLPERITDYILQEGTDNPESAARFRQGIIEAAATGFMPPSAVYGAVPIVELTTNYSFFSDMPIVSQRLQGLEPSQQYTANTSEFAKNVGDAINFSPMKIDYIFNAIGGTSAGALLQLADVVMGSNKMAADKYPVIGSFQQKTVGGRYTEEYYALRELTEQAYNTAKAIQEEGDQDKLEAYISRPEIQARLAAREGVESIHTSLSEVSKQRNAIMNSPYLTPDEKRQAVNELLSNVESSLRDMQIRRVRSEIE